tara:strand:- start:1390 stop:1863 length:474 start_codon:yes stop_codon:yes gene_type:complete
MANGKREERSILGKIADSVGDFLGGVANDIAIGTGLKDDPGPTPRDDMAGRQSSYQRRTAAAVEANKANEAYYADNNSSLAQSNRNIAAARRAATNIAPVAAAPSVPDPNAIGETEQALLDAQKKGRSSTIATSAKGLLSDEDSTRKKRSLMSGLLS